MTDPQSDITSAGARKTNNPATPTTPRSGLTRSPAYLSLVTYDNMAPVIPPRRPRANTEPFCLSSATTQSNDALRRINQLETQLHDSRTIARTTKARLERHLTTTRTKLEQTCTRLDTSQQNLALSHMNARNLASQISTQQSTIQDLQTSVGRMRIERQRLINDLQHYTTQLVGRVNDLQLARTQLRASQDMGLRLGMELMEEQRHRREETPAWASRRRHCWEGENRGDNKQASQVIASPSNDTHNIIGDGTNEQRTECSICLQDTREGEDSDAMRWANLPCGHTFHVSCIRHWHHQSFNCPYCRQPFEWRLRNRAAAIAADGDSDEDAAELHSTINAAIVDGGRVGEAEARSVPVVAEMTAGLRAPPILPDGRLRARVRRFWRRTTGRDWRH